jgi:cell division protein FtsW
VREQQDQFVILSITGIMAQFAIQSLINIGVNLHLLPTKGMTLPFISYGGSSNLALSIGMGMFLALSKKKADLKYYKIKNTNF